MRLAFSAMGNSRIGLALCLKQQGLGFGVWCCACHYLCFKIIGLCDNLFGQSKQNKVEIIVYEMPFDIRPTSFDRLDTLMSSVAMLVNTTILGMKGAPTFDFDIPRLPKNAWVSDLIYNPLETPLINKARAQNLHIIDGLNMLLYQAIPVLWHGLIPQMPEVLPLCAVTCLMPI